MGSKTWFAVPEIAIVAVNFRFAKRGKTGGERQVKRDWTTNKAETSNVHERTPKTAFSRTSS